MMSSHNSACYKESQKPIIYRVRNTGDFAETIANPNTILSKTCEVPTPLEVTISARGQVRNGAIGGTISKAEMLASGNAAPVYARVSWGGGTNIHAMFLSVTRTVILSLPASNSTEVVILGSAQRFDQSTNEREEFNWPGVPNTQIYANFVEVTIVENHHGRPRIEQLLTCDLLVNAMGVARQIIEIPPMAEEIQYIVYPVQVFIPTINGFMYPVTPAVTSPPFYLKSFEPGNFLPGPPISVLPGLPTCIDRTSVAVTTHFSPVNSRANITFKLKSP